MGYFHQMSFWGWLRDVAFITYQANIIPAMGCVAGLVVILLFSVLANRFWAALVPFCLCVGVLVVGEYDRFGVAHVTMLPLELLGLTLLAGSLPLGKFLGRALVIGCLFDLALGIGLQIGIEHREGLGVVELSRAAQWSWQEKHRWPVTFLGDHF